MRTLKALEFAEKPQGKGYHADGQHTFSHEPVFFLQSDREERYGFDRGFTGGSAERDQCAGGCVVYETAERMW